MNKNNLPYFKTKTNDKTLSNFLLRKYNFLLRKHKLKIKERLKEHYLVQPIPKKSLDFIRNKSKQYPYFLYFDIHLYFPSINQEILIKEIPETYKQLAKKSISRRFKTNITIVNDFLKQSPYKKDLAIGSKLSYVLAGIFLLKLDLKIPRPFLRQTDDYLVFCKNKREPEQILKQVVIPILNDLHLEINEKKLISGRFHKNKVSFIGFDFYAGYFSIKENKIQEFKNRIINITHLTKKKHEKAIIKLLNNQILGFGHYYKICSCKKEFDILDSFIRMRLRRYLSRNKDSKNKQGNLILTNNTLNNMGLKSLLEIKEKYDQKKKGISRKKKKKELKTGQKTYNNNSLLNNIDFKYQQKLILEQLNKLTSLIKNMEKNISKLNQNLINKNKD